MEVNKRTHLEGGGTPLNSILDKTTVSPISQICKCLPIVNKAINKKKINEYSSILSYRMRFSATIKNAVGKKAQSYKTANEILNEYGRWSGAPGGYGASPKNNF